MITSAPCLTEQGKSLLLRAVGGEAITFTRFEAGSGLLPALQEPGERTALVETVLSFPIRETDARQAGVLAVAGEFSSSDVSADFYWRELGLFAQGEDETEILYAYTNDGQDAAIVRRLSPWASAVQEVRLLVTIGEAENVTAVYSTVRPMLQTAGEPQPPGTPTRGSADTASRADHVHPPGVSVFTLTLAASGWANGEQTVQDARFAAAGFVYTVEPTAASRAEYFGADVYPADQAAAGALTFYAGDTPLEDITLKIRREACL